MKKIIIATYLLIVTSHAIAQLNNHYHSNLDNNIDPDNFGFNKQSLFIGGTLSFGGSNYDFNAGISPEIGFTVKQWLDVGALLNINYFSERPDPTLFYNDNTRTRSFNYGAGAFARLYPIHFLFVQVEPELNFVNTNYKYFGSPVSTYSNNTQAPSLLLGAGYCQRIAGRSNFYIAVMFDAFNNPNSPYRDVYANTNVAVPIFKAGFDIYLHPKE
ncbi:MAG TPA: hypothetical protein VK705_05295 [Ferruginibacter sp.]|jgi:hypothetical protein|nr:hypothetical protein [Ferruginibacter sp.]